MCVEKIQKLILASILGMVLMFAGIKAFAIAFMLQVMLMVMLIISGLTGFCSITNLLSRAFPPCKQNNNEENR
jgi:hypothetical protein